MTESHLDLVDKIETNLDRFQALADIIGTMGEAENHDGLTPKTLRVLGVWMEELALETTDCFQKIRAHENNTAQA